VSKYPVRHSHVVVLALANTALALQEHVRVAGPSKLQISEQPPLLVEHKLIAETRVNTFDQKNWKKKFKTNI
jgi:hypothetical protein